MITSLLDRPLAVFDIESTGLNRKTDRIIDLAILVLHPDGTRDTHTFRVNPEQPIPSDSTAVHGISDADVQDAPTFRQVAHEVADVLRGCDFGGFNVTRYDAPLLQEEFVRAGIPFSMEGRRILDAQRIYHLKEPRDLTAALQFYCGEDHAGAHGALDDAEATLRVLEAQLQRYADLPPDLNALAEWCNPRDPTWADSEGKIRWRDGDLVINFGQKHGTRLKELVMNNRGFLEWMLKSDFPEDTKELVRDALNNRYPTAPV
jgi:DNA polymerase-3 subunit epsilon